MSAETSAAPNAAKELEGSAEESECAGSVPKVLARSTGYRIIGASTKTDNIEELANSRDGESGREVHGMRTKFDMLGQGLPESGNLEN